MTPAAPGSRSAGAPSVRDWLIAAAARIEAALGPSHLRRVALPPMVDRPGKEGEFCAVQLDDGSVGLSFTLLDGTLVRQPPNRTAGCAFSS